jgi:hypothetical protein
MITLYHQRLEARGHSQDDLRRWFIEAADSKIDNPRLKRQSIGKPLFIHVNYHPAAHSRKEIRSLFMKHCEKSFRQKNNNGAAVGTENVVIAYSRSPNIGDMTRRSRLRQNKEQDTLVSGRIELLQATTGRQQEQAISHA